jgi:hypothetical protein
VFAGRIIDVEQLRDMQYKAAVEVGGRRDKGNLKIE